MNTVNKLKDCMSSGNVKKEVAHIGSKVNDWWWKCDSFK